MNDYDKIRLKNMLVKKFRDNHDLIDIDAEIDSTLTLGENYNIIMSKYSDYAIDEDYSIMQEKADYVRAIKEQIPENSVEDRFIKEIIRIKKSKSVKSSAKSRSMANLKDKVLKDVDDKMVNRIVDDYGN